MRKNSILKQKTKKLDMGGNLLFARLVFEKKLHHHIKDNKELINDRKDLLLKVINYDTVINKLLSKRCKQNKECKIYTKHDWRFAGIKKGEDYIYGKLGKIATHNLLQPNDEKRDFIITKANEAFILYFLIDLENNIIAYEAKQNIGDKAPLIIISETFNQFFEDKETLKMNLLADPRKILKRIMQLRRVKEIDLTITPSNPHSAKPSDEMDKLLKNGNITRLIIKGYSQHKDGILLDKIPLIKSGFYLAEEGFGSAKAKETDENSITTGDIPIRRKGKVLENMDEENISHLKYHIREILKILEGKNV